jgi:uncharacterized membrane protein YphA (DoxX/SURF4 family)
MTIALSVHLFARDFLALTMLVSGTAKLVDNAAFRRALSTYQIFSARFARGLTWVVPLTEIALSAWLLAGPVVQLSAFAATVTLATFTAVVAWNLAHGLKFSCGCFGSDDVPATWFTVLRNIPLVLISIYLVLAPKSGGSAVSSGDAVLILLTAAAVLGIVALAYSWHKLPELDEAEPAIVGAKSAVIEVTQ